MALQGYSMSSNRASKLDFEEDAALWKTAAGEYKLPLCLFSLTSKAFNSELNAVLRTLGEEAFVRSHVNVFIINAVRSYINQEVCKPGWSFVI